MLGNEILCEFNRNNYVLTPSIQVYLNVYDMVCSDVSFSAVLCKLISDLTVINFSYRVAQSLRLVTGWVLVRWIEPKVYNDI